MDPSEGSSNKYHAVSKQDDGKFEEELPSSSRFFPYIEVKELSDILTQERIPCFGPSFSEDVFDINSKEDLKVAEERERQLAAVRKRARHLKDTTKKGNEINLNMKDKQLEKIVAAIADVCELKVTVSGKEFINTLDNKNKELASVSEFVEKAERAAMLMKRDNSALTAKVDKEEREKMRSDDTSTIYTNEAESEFTTEQLTEALSNIKADISNEKERHKELQRRLRNLRTPSGSVVKTNGKNLEANHVKPGSDFGTISHKGQDEMKSLRVSCLSPYDKLPPIPDPKCDSSTQYYPERHRKVPEHMDPNEDHTDLNSKPTTHACATMRASKSTRWCPLTPYPTNASPNKQREREPNRSPPTTLSKSLLPLHTRAIRHERYRYSETPFTCTVTNNWSTRLPVKTKAGTTDSSRIMSYEPMGLKRPQDVPIYVRKYRIHRRSRSVKLQAVSPTTGTPKVLTDFADNCSSCTSP